MRRRLLWLLLALLRPLALLLLSWFGPDPQRVAGAMTVANRSSAASSEWRTAPLWGLGLTRRINPQATDLHDGRAPSLEEAILWHGGEASGSRDRYLGLAPRQRQALLRWLGQL